jgi:hypothetical protein
MFRLSPRTSQRHGTSDREAWRYRPRVETLEDRMLPSTFVVTSHNDSGPGSLRTAILNVNADPSLSLDTIDFNIAPTAPPFINLTSALPVITHQVFIDGSSQFGFMGTPIVELNGAAAPGATGLVIRATGPVTPFVGAINALKIDNFSTGIRILDTGSSTPANMSLVNNSIVSTPGGNGIVFLAGTADTTALFMKNAITTAGIGHGIAALTAGTTDKLTFAGNTIMTSGGGDGIITQGTAASTFLTFNSNTLVVKTGGQGIALSTSPNSTAAAFASNTITTIGGGNGVAIATAGKSTVFNFSGNTVHATGDAILVSGNALANSLTFASNPLLAGTDALVLTLSTSSKTNVRVTNNTLTTGGVGTGLMLQGGPTFQALVQGNNCNGNLVGIAVCGDGTTAGNVDLGGGLLGSTGGNDFTTFPPATKTSYAIGLFKVASTYIMDAKFNLFIPPATAHIADSTHDTIAGGRGSIIT